MKQLLEEIKSTTKEMIDKNKEYFDVYTFNSPIEMIVEFSDTSKADMVESMPLTERIDGRKVKISSDNYRVIFEALLAITYICEA
jgi:D-amino peptidase